MIGAPFMAAGGGSPRDALRLLDEPRSLDKANIAPVNRQDIGEDEWGVRVAKSCDAETLSDAEAFPETALALTSIQGPAAGCGEDIKCLAAREPARFNTMVPLYVDAPKWILPAGGISLRHLSAMRIVRR